MPIGHVRGSSSRDGWLASCRRPPLHGIGPGPGLRPTFSLEGTSGLSTCCTSARAPRWRSACWPTLAPPSRPASMANGIDLRRPAWRASSALSRGVSTCAGAAMPRTESAARRDDRWRRTGGGRASPPCPLHSPALSHVPYVPGVAGAVCLIAWLRDRLEAGPHREPAERGCATEARDRLTTRWSRPASRVGSIGVRLAFVETGGSSRSHRAVGRKPRGASAFRWLSLDPPPDSVESVLLSVRERVVPRSPP